MLLTFDVETYPRLKGNAHFLSRQAVVWHQILERVHEARIRTTCFVTGEFAARHEDLLSLMLSHGHEIASHTMHHIRFRDEAREAFEKDVGESKAFLENMTGAEVLGFRSPHGHAPRDLARMLHSFGYLYDSSVASTYIAVHFDGRGAPRTPYRASYEDVRRADEASDVWEVPIHVVPGVRIPAGGIFLTALAPLFNRFPRALPAEAVVYAHPHDFIPLQRYAGILPWSYLKWHGSYWRFLDKALTRHAGADMRIRARLSTEPRGREAARERRQTAVVAGGG